MKGPSAHPCCKCAEWGAFGLRGLWFCAAHLPPDYWGAGAAAPAAPVPATTNKTVQGRLL